MNDEVELLVVAPLVYENTKVCELYAVRRGMGFGGWAAAPDVVVELQLYATVEVEAVELEVLEELEDFAELAEVLELE